MFALAGFQIQLYAACWRSQMMLYRL